MDDFPVLHHGRYAFPFIDPFEFGQKIQFWTTIGIDNQQLHYPLWVTYC